MQQPTIIAGPCSIENYDQLSATIAALNDIPQVSIIRLGIWKPRTRPNGFEGIGQKALPWIDELHEKYPRLRFCCEVAQPAHVELIKNHPIDTIWIGARTTSNPFSVAQLADALQGSNLHILVKNPTVPDVNLWQGAIERILKSEPVSIAAVHRGFSTYSNTGLRNNPLWEIPIELHRRMPSIPILCDPSHIAGSAKRVMPIASMAISLGFDGLMIETHNNPSAALTDASQQVTPAELQQILQNIKPREFNSATDANLLLANLRSQIDDIDSQLISLIAQRMHIAQQISTIKHNNNLTILQPDRWQHVLDSRTQQGLTKGLDPSFIQQLFQTIHTQSIKVQLKDQ